MIKTSKKSGTQRFDDFILFSLENDDMESSKRCVQLFSLVLHTHTHTHTHLKIELINKTFSVILSFTFTQSSDRL